MSLRVLHIASACVISCVCTGLAWADLPLAVEDIITEKGKFKLDTSVSYANAERQSVAVGDDVVVEVGPGALVVIPVAVGDNQRNSDTWVATLGLRYGLTDDVEVYTRGSYLYDSERSDSPDGVSSNSYREFADSWVGVNYQFKDDDDTPAVLGFGEIALHERGRDGDSAFAKSALVGVTSYKAIDPVVFSVTSAYRMYGSRREGESMYKPGNYFFISPSVGFAANDRVTLTTGLQWLNQEASRKDDVPQGMRQTSTHVQLGIGYGVSENDTLNFTLKQNASGRGGADLRVSWSHTF